MVKNIIIEVLEKIINCNDLTTFVCGHVVKPGTEECDLEERCGSVYGFAIKIEDEEDRCNIFNLVKSHGDLQDDFKLEDWKEITSGYYPLYWGKDKTMGTRINAHMKSYKNTGTIRLNKKKYLADRDIIFGTIQCSKYEEYEKSMRNIYPDILKTKNK